MISMDAMDDAIDYQMMCDAGFSPSIFVAEEIHRKKKELQDTQNTITSELNQRIQNTAEILEDMVNEVKGYKPYCAAEPQIKNLTNTLHSLKEQHQTISTLLNSVARQADTLKNGNKILLATLPPLRNLLKEAFKDDPLICFLNESNNKICTYTAKNH
jgi:hypothetical protein